jgi:hypothetical protein
MGSICHHMDLKEDNFKLQERNYIQTFQQRIDSFNVSDKHPENTVRMNF